MMRAILPLVDITLDVIIVDLVLIHDLDVKHMWNRRVFLGNRDVD